MLNVKKILQPQYYAKFSCIGNICEDTCCGGWNIAIDKDTYKKYRKCIDVNLKPILDKKVTRNRSTASNDNYAKIVLNEKKICPFLTGENLCDIQKKIGEDYLSVTCVTYPRTVYLVDGVVERSLHISCPEASRLVLLNPNLMEFDEINSTNNTRIYERIINTSDFKRSTKPYQFFWELRSFTIFILQNRTYPLWKRLIIVGLFFDQLNQLIERKEQGLPELISTYSNRINEGVFHEFLDDIPSKLTMQLELQNILINLRVHSNFTTERFLECLNEFTKGIQSTSEDTKEESYKKAYSQYYKPFMEQHEYIMENYLVNYVFKNLFPFGSQKDIYAEYILMATHYAIIQSLLIGISGYHKANFCIDHVIKLIQSFAKTIEHNSSYLKYVGQFFEDNNLKNLACMAILIKN